MIKKLLFLTFLITVAVSSAFPQSKQPVIIGAKDALQWHKHKTKPDGSPCAISYVKKENSKFLTPKLIGQSANPYCLSQVPINNFSFNEDVGTFTFTANTDNVGTSGGTVTSFHYEGYPNSFVPIQPWQIPAPGLNARFPAGVIYNPSGNTQALNSYIITTGPLYDGEAVGAFYASQKLDGSAPDQQYTLFATDTAGGTGFLNRNPNGSLQAKGDRFFALGDSHEDDGTRYTKICTVINRGIWQGSGVVWTRDTLVPSFNNSNGYPQGFETAVLAMNNDAKNGFLVFTGRNPDASDTLSFQPLIYTSADSAKTWTKMPFNWQNISLISNLAAASSPVGRPFFSKPLDAVIDINGHLHCCFFVFDAVSDHTDSLNFYGEYSTMKGIVIDLHQTVLGWDAFIIDTVYAKDAEDFPFPGLTSDDRFQMSVNESGSFILYAWNDSDSLLDSYNKFPDIWVRGYYIINDIFYEKHNFTKNTQFDGACFGMKTTDYISRWDNGEYDFFFSVSDYGDYDTDSVNHYFFFESFHGNINSEDFSSGLSVYPNPAGNEVYLKVNNSHNIYTISLFTIHGQPLLTKTTSEAESVLDLSLFPTGVYCVKVQSKGICLTRRIVKI